MNPRLEKLQTLLKLTSEGLTREEFLKAFKQVMAYVKGIQQNNTTEFDLIHKAFDVLKQKVQDDASKDVSELKAETKRLVQEQITSIQARLAKVQNGEKGDPGIPGPKGDSIVGPPGPPGPQSFDTSEDVRNKLELLQGDERLDKTAVKGIEDIEKKVQEISIRPRGGGGKGFMLLVGGTKKLLTAQTLNFVAGSGMTISYAYKNGRNDITFTATGSASLTPITVTGTVDDSNLSFTAASVPNLVIVNGQSYRDGHGVTIVGTAITVDAPVGKNGDIYAL